MERPEHHLVSGEDSPAVCSRSGAQLGPGTGDEDPERREVTLTPASDRGAEPGGGLKGEGGDGASTSEMEEEEEEEEEGASLQEGVKDDSEMAPQSMAGDSSEVPQKKKRKRNKSKKGPSSSGEQNSLPSLNTALAQTTELPNTCVIPQEVQTLGSELAKPGAGVLAGDNRDAKESKRVLGDMGKDTGILEVVAEDSHSSVDAITPPKQSSTDNVAAPSPSSVAPKEKVEDGSTMECGEVIRSNVEGGGCAPDADQLPESSLESQSSESSKKLASTGERASVSSELSPGTQAPTSKPATPHAERQDTKTPPVVKGLQAGKKTQDSRQKANSSPSKNEDRKEKKKTPNEKVDKVTEKTSPTKRPEVTEKTSLTKGPEVARRDYASAVTDSKDKNQQRNQKPVDKIKDSSVSQSDDVTVYFHAILSNDFKKNPETHRVFIRAEGIFPYENWKDNICEMNCIKHLGEHGYLIQGTVTLSKQNLNKSIAYKYFVEGDYEFIYKDPVSGGYVNRCLFIKSQLLYNREWHQYDDIVCVKPSTVKNVWNRFVRSKNKDVVKGKIIAANIMLENIFSVLQTCSPDNVRNFLHQLKQFYAVTVDPWVYDGKPTQWTELGFGKEQVNDLLLKYVKIISLPFLAPEDEKASQGKIVIKSKLALGLSILTAAENLELPATKSYLSDMCSLLCLDKGSQQEILDEIHHMQKAFLGTSLKVHLTNLCQRCIDEQIHQWVWILPLLHLFAAPLQQDHLPMEEDTWAGLEGLPFAETRKKQDGETLLKLMEEKKYLMEFDKTLVKSWICVLPLESLAKFIEDFSSDLLAIIQGVSYRIGNADFPWQNKKIVVGLLKALLCTLDEKQTRSGGSLLAVILDLFLEDAQEDLQLHQAWLVVRDSCHFCQDDFKGCQFSACSSEYRGTIHGLIRAR